MANLPPNIDQIFEERLHSAVAATQEAQAVLATQTAVSLETATPTLTP